MRYRRHFLELYGVQLWHASNYSQYRALNRDQLSSALPDYPTSLGRTDKGDRDGRLEIAIFTHTNGQSELEAIRTCIHEAVHAAGYILDHIGQKDENDRGSEAMAYLTEWIASWLIDGIARHYRKS